MPKESFNHNRIAFAILDTDVVFTEPGDQRPAKQWLESLGVGDDAFGRIIRGYMLPGKVQFFTGFDYAVADMSKVSASHFCAIMDKYNAMYPDQRPYVYNGVIKGEPGEVWPPVITLGCF